MGVRNVRRQELRRLEAKTLGKLSNFINGQQQPLASALRMGATEAAGLGTVGAVTNIASQLNWLYRHLWLLLSQRRQIARDGARAGSEDAIGQVFARQQHALA